MPRSYVVDLVAADRRRPRPCPGGMSVEDGLDAGGDPGEDVAGHVGVEVVLDADPAPLVGPDRCGPDVGTLSIVLLLIVLPVESDVARRDRRRRRGCRNG